MGIDIFRWIRGRPATARTRDAPIKCDELMEAALEYQIRELCFWVCVDMIANAMGRCEFKTYRANQEIFEREYYTWNIAPNRNQNATAFMHKLIAKLYSDNEALIFSRAGSGGEEIYVADSWTCDESEQIKPRVYYSVTVGGTTAARRFTESEVMHLTLNHVNMRPIINGMYQSYYRMLNAAVKNYQYNHGQHWKVHVSQIQQGDKNFSDKFTKMIQEQVKPFLESNGAILPEFEGYEYSNVGSGSGGDSRDIKNIVEDIFEFTARGLLLPIVLVNGKVEATADANTRFLTACIDPLCDQIGEEAVRKRYGYDEWRNGNFIKIDSSSIVHFDMFAAAANVEKLVGSGAYSLNDVRRATGQATIPEPWADKHYMTLNIATAGETTKEMTGGENDE